MLRIIETFNNLPVNIEVDPDATFQPGHIGSLRIKKGKSIIGVCDGLHPFGILDDIKSDKYRCVFEKIYIIIIPQASIIFDTTKREIVLAKDHKIELAHKDIISKSFTSSVNGQLNAKTGVFTLSKGTSTNFCSLPGLMDKNNVNDSVRFVCRYAYNVSAGKFDDTTASTNRTTIWTKNMIAATDMYDTAQAYTKYSLLYVENGLLTTKRIDAGCKTIGVVLEEPTSSNSLMLKFLLDLDNKIDISCQENLI